MTEFMDAVTRAKIVDESPTFHELAAALRQAIALLDEESIGAPSKCKRAYERYERVTAFARGDA